MARLKRAVLLVALLCVLLFSGSALAQDEAAAEPETESAPQGVDLGVLILGGVVVLAVAGYMAVNTKIDKES
jgi:uncharacterized membrane protein YphA (DoxX/SURF4 family)